MGTSYHGREIRVEHMSENKENGKEVCINCRSFSGKKRNGNGWCMKLRKAKKWNEWCGNWK